LQTDPILDDFTAAVYQAISGRDIDDTSLERLVTMGALLSLETGYYRVPPIWTPFLRNRIPDRAALYDRAARWYAQQGEVDSAVQYALHGVGGLAIELIRQHGARKIARGELIQLRRWLETLTEQVILADSSLSRIYAWALVHGGDLDAVERYLHHPAHSPGDVYAIRARAAAIRGNKREQAEFSDKALQYTPETDFSLRAELMLNLGCAYLELGETAKGYPILVETQRLSRTASNPRAEVFAYFFMGKIRAAQGRLAQALHTYEEGLTRTGNLAVSGVLHVGIAETLYEYNELAAARSHLDQALAEPGGEIKPVVYGNIALGLLLPPDEAVQRLEQVASLTGWTLIYAWQTLWWLRAGNVTMASYWLEDSRNAAPLSEFERMVQARVLIALKRWDDARALLDDLTERATRDERRGDLIKILLLEMLLAYGQERTADALRCLNQALKLGETEGYFRTFVDEGEPLQRLCLQLAQPDNHYVRRILQYFTKNTASTVRLPFGETLSQREIEVLALIVEGLSNESIAQQLFLTQGTVKWHVHNIFGKLDVRNRAQAIKRAKELEILSA